MKKYFLILLLTVAGYGQTLQSPEYKNVKLSKRPALNSGNALVAPYFSSITGGVTYSNASGTTEAIMISHQFRIRQDGTVKAIQLYTSNKTNLTTFKVRVYRANGANYDLIGESEDISASLSASGSATVTLTKPITGVMQGDYYGFISTQSGAWDGLRVFDSATESLTNTFIRKSTNGSAFANTSQALSMRIYMDKPNIIFLGSSITEGLNSNQSFLHSDGTIFNSSVYWGDMLASKLGFKYQNMGIGGSSSSMILARVNTDVISNLPNYVTIQGTVNDIIAGTATATIIANFDAIISACVTAGIKPIVLPILPYNGDTNANYQKRDAINAGIKASALSYGAIFIDGIDQALGVFKTGGDVGNLWNLNPLYNSDNYHLNLAGTTVLTNTIYDVIKTSVLSGALVSSSVLTDDLTVNNLANSNGTDQYYPLANSTGSLEKGQISKSAIETTKFGGTYNFRINNNPALFENSVAVAGVGLNYVNNLSIYPAGLPSETQIANTGFKLLYSLADTNYRSAIAIDNLPTSNTGMLRLMEREGNVNIGTGAFDTSAKVVVYGSLKLVGGSATVNSLIGNTNLRISTAGTNDMSFFTGSTANEKARMFGPSGRWAFQNGGTFTDNGVDEVQITGTASGTVDATLSNQFVRLGQIIPLITITTSVSITTATTDAGGLGQNGRHVVISNGASAINLTCSGGVTTSYGKVGSGAITFVQGSGRTLVQLSGTAILNGIAGSRAILWSSGTTDYLEIINY